MLIQRKFLIFAICIGALYAEAVEQVTDSTGMFTENALKQCDSKLISDEMTSVLAQCSDVFSRIERMIQNTRGSESVEIKAISKRLEIAQNLQKHIHSLQNGDAGQKILAWQAAKEMQVLLNYFKEEISREKARTALPETKKLSLRDFGAVGDGKADDGPAFRRVFDAIKSYGGKPVELFVPAGTYRITPDSNPLPQFLNLRMADTDGKMSKRSGQLARVNLLLVNVDHFIIRGEPGTKLLFTDSTMPGIRLLGCRDIVLQNIEINYADNPSTQGKIVEIEEDCKSFVVKIDPGYPAPDDPRFLGARSRRLTSRYPGNVELYGNESARMGKVERIDSETFRIFPLPNQNKHHSWQNLKKGMKFSIIARCDDANAVDFRYCRFCSVRNVTIKKAPGVAFRLFRNYAPVLSRARIETADYVSSNADGAQCSGAIGPYVENCYFSKMEDDGFNFNSPAPELESISADRKTTVPFASQGAFLISGVTGKIKAVLQTSPDSPKKYLAPIPSDSITNESIKKISIEEKLRQDYFGANAEALKRPDRLVLMPSDLSGTVVVNSEFYNIRGLGLQITAPNVLVENCKIHDMTAFGININSMLPWGMCFNPHNVIIRGCQFSGNRAPDISLQFRALNNKEILEPKNIRGIQIENCKFEPQAWCSIELRNAADVSLTGNQFRAQNSDWKMIHCTNIGNISIRNCRFELPNAKNAIFYSNSQDRKSVKTENNRIQR